MKAVVLAGGLGTRLRAAVPDLPKPMAPVAGRPFLAWLLDSLARGGCQAVTLSVGYRWEVIRAHFGARFGDLAVNYAVEDAPLGTGGAVAHALDGAGLGDEEPVLILNGDTFLAIDWAAFGTWQACQSAQPAIVLRQVDDTARYGRVGVSGGQVVAFEEKGRGGPGLINAGIYVLPAGVFRRFDLNGRFSLEADLLQKHTAALGLRAFATDAWFIDIGVPEDYARAQTELPIHAR